MPLTWGGLVEDGHYPCTVCYRSCPMSSEGNNCGVGIDTATFTKTTPRERARFQLFLNLAKFMYI